MPGLNTDPIAAVTIPGGNGDLPAAQFPSLTRIAVVDLVGPNAANRQHKALEKRTVALAQLVNALIANNNVIDNNYLRRDGSSQKDSTAGIRGNMPMGGFQLTGLPAGSVAGHAVEYAQLVAALVLKASLASPALTGTPTAPTPPTNSDSTRIATTDWVRDRISEVSSTPSWATVAGFDASQPVNSANYTGMAPGDPNASGGGTHYIWDVPLTNGTGGLLSVIFVECTPFSGSFDWNDGPPTADFIVTLVGPSGAAIAPVSPMPLGFMKVAGLTGNSEGPAVGTEYVLAPTTGWFKAAQTGNPNGGVVLLLTGLRRSLLVAPHGDYFARVTFSTTGPYHNVPGSRVRGYY